MKTFTIPISYGYQELRQVHHRYMMLALLMAITVQIMIIGAYDLSEWLKVDNKIGISRPQIRFELLPLPLSLTNPMPNIGTAIIPMKFSVGIPIPVPDCDVNPEIEFTPQPNTPNPTDPNIYGSGGIGDGGLIVIPRIRVILYQIYFNLLKRSQYLFSQLLRITLMFHSGQALKEMS